MGIHKNVLKELKLQWQPAVVIKFTLDPAEIVDDAYTIWVLFEI